MRTSARIGNVFDASADRQASRLAAIRAIVGLATDAEIYEVAAVALRVLGASEEEIMVAMFDDPTGNH